MMPTREELYTALRNADRAGDAAGARKLASYIRSLPADEVKPTKSEAKDDPGIIASVGAGLGKGFGEAVLGAQSLVGKGLQKVGAQSAGNWLVNDANAGRVKLADELRPYKDANPVSAGAGELGGNIVATLPVGAGLAGGLRAAAPLLARAGASSPVVEQLATAIATAGARTGAPAAATAAGRAVNLGIRAAGGAVTGGASAGIIDPDQALSGAITGAVLPPALAAAGRTAGYVGNAARAAIRPFTAKGQDAIAADIIRNVAEGAPLNINAAELVPGSIPTLTEATGNAGVAGLQRVARDIRPNAFDLREQGNAAARSALFDQTAGNRGAIQTARAERDFAADALYGKAFSAENMRQAMAAESLATRAPFSGVGLSGAAEDLSTPGLRALMSRPGFKAAAQDAKRLAADNGVQLDDPLQSLQGLHYIKLALDDALNPAAKTALGRNASSAVMNMRDRLSEELAKISPLYGVGRARFAEMSQPINAMEALQDLRLTDAKGNITLAKVKSSIEQLEKARRAPGVDPAKSITSDQMHALSAIHDDLLRQSTLGAGKSVGSNTFQNISTNNLLSAILPGNLGSVAQGKVGGVVGQIGRLAYSGPNEAIRNRLVDMLLDPAAAEAALNSPRGGQSQALRTLLESIAQPTYRGAPLVGSSDDREVKLRDLVAKERR